MTSSRHGSASATARWAAQICASLVLLLAALFASPALAAPPLWRISDGDSQIWLFGSIHAFDTRVSWRTPAFNKALRAADLVYFETPLAPDDQATMRAVIARYGLAPKGRTLQSYLSRNQKIHLAAVLATLGIEPGSVEHLRPWLAAETLGGIVADVAGLRTRPGVEDSIAKDIPAKKQRGFEDYEEHIRVMADLSTRQQVDMLMTAIGYDTGDSTPAIDVVAPWKAGDLDRLYADVTVGIGKPGSEMYDALITKRNKRWVPQILKLLKTDKDAMVIVGIAHYLGPNGLISLLQKRGIDVERIQ